MIKQLSAERLRRAAIISADGTREAAKTSAEGNAAALIATSRGEELVSVLNAQADYEAKTILAEAEATAINTIAESVTELGGEPTRYLIACKYIETLKSIALGASSRLVYFPFETEVFGSLARIR
jgi:regulator of protease activity HflC (stomatin/prohibitin superfamily)